MQDLIDKLESVSEGSRELDAEIWSEVHKHLIDDTTYITGTVENYRELTFKRPLVWPWTRVPFYTTSIDAALLLVPEGWEMTRLDKDTDDRWSAYFNGTKYKADYTKGNAATPALAIVAAALRARKEMDQ